MLLCDIIKNLADKKIISLKECLQASSINQLQYHNIKNTLKVIWNDENKIEEVTNI
jgi:hypothetical protein